MSVNFHEQGLIPTILYFQNGGVFTGSRMGSSKQEFRYMICPDKNSMYVEVWYGPYNHEKSEILDRFEISLNEDGREDMLKWLEQKCEDMLQE